MQGVLYLLFDRSITKDGKYVHAQSFGLTHKPHIFHHAAKPHEPDCIAFRVRGMDGRVIQNHQ